MGEVEDVLDHVNFALSLLVDVDDDVDRKVDGDSETSGVGNNVPLWVVSTFNMDPVHGKTDGALDVNALSRDTTLLKVAQIERVKVGLTVFI